MKELSKIMATALAMCSFAANQSAAENIKFEPQKTLVVYFSAGGNTARAANLIAQNLGAKIIELKPAQPYTNADMNPRLGELRDCFCGLSDLVARCCVADRRVYKKQRF